VAIGAAVFTGAGSYASAAAFGDGFGPALGVAAAFSLLGAASAALLPARRRTQDTPAGSEPAIVVPAIAESRAA
jgi:hypothetical protein